MTDELLQSTLIEFRADLVAAHCWRRRGEKGVHRAVRCNCRWLQDNESVVVENQAGVINRVAEGPRSLFSAREVRNGAVAQQFY